MSDEISTLFDTGEGTPFVPEPNPCVRVYGPGPEGARCKDCALLDTVRWNKRYHKCSLRRRTRGAATDHRVRWKACAKFKEYVT